MPFERISFPFTAFVSQEPLKLALTLNAINPELEWFSSEAKKGHG